MEFEFLKNCLADDEHILWQGKPEKGHYLSSSDIFLIPFSLVWCGFAIFWEITALTSGAPAVFGLFGVPFVLIGLYLVFGRFIHTARTRQKSAYVITNKRIIRKVGNKVEILDGKNLPPMEISIFDNNKGEIVFGEIQYHYRRGRRYAERPTFRLENIPDVLKVQQIISDTFLN